MKVKEFSIETIADRFVTVINLPSDRFQTPRRVQELTGSENSPGTKHNLIMNY